MRREAEPAGFGHSLDVMGKSSGLNSDCQNSCPLELKNVTLLEIGPLLVAVISYGP